MIALIVLAKAPIPGQVKTRLIPVLSADQAADLAADLLKETIKLAGQLKGVSCKIAISPSDQLDSVRKLLSTELTIIPQPKGDLGERLAQLFEASFSEGAGGVIVLGADHPGLPLSYLEEAATALQGRKEQVVLGPTKDGGYYLVGLTEPAPKLFEEIPWSTSQVFEQTLQRAEKLGLSVKQLPSWFDLDRPEDLKRYQSTRKEFKQSSG